MQETKFNLYGEFIRPNGFQKYDILSYIAETREEAIATCRKNNPHFNIITIQVDDTTPEVVKVQSIAWLMQTTTATYQIQVTTEEGHLSFLKFMPTKPKTSKGIKSQNNKLSKWVEKTYPTFISYDINPANWHHA